MKKVKYLLPSLLLSASVASAQTFLEFDFQGTQNATFVDGSFIDNTVPLPRFGTETVGAGNSANASQNSSGSITNIGPGTDEAGTSYALGTATTQYGQANGFAATFDATNANGLYGADATDFVPISFEAVSAFTLDTLSFDMGQGGSSGPRGYTVGYTLNGGSFNLLGVGALDEGNNQFGRYTFDFGNIALSNGDDVELRFLGFSTGTNNSIRIDNIAVAAVPEPAAAGLLIGLGAFALMLVRRRR